MSFWIEGLGQLEQIAVPSVQAQLVDFGWHLVVIRGHDSAQILLACFADGSPFFNLIATNGQVIGSSQMYANEANRDNGIASVMNNAPDAEIVDLTGA